MSEIELKRANVVKRVDSEDKAKALEAKGFVRTDGTVTNNKDIRCHKARGGIVKWQRTLHRIRLLQLQEGKRC